MTYRQLIQNYLDASYMYPPNTANQCGPCPQIVQPVYDPCTFPTYYVACTGAEPCEEEKPCSCKKKKPRDDGCIEIDICYVQQTKCSCKKKSPCSCKKKPACSCKKKPKCPPPRPNPCCSPCTKPCCPPPCPPPCNDPCNPIKGWPWITQTWGGQQR